MCKTSGFHLSVRVSSDNTRRTSKGGNNTSQATRLQLNCPSFFLTCFEVIRALAEDTRNDKWNLYLLNITNYKRRVYINNKTALEIKSQTKTVSVKETHKTEKAITVPHNLSYTKTTNSTKMSYFPLTVALPGRGSFPWMVAGSSRMIWWSSSVLESQRLHLKEHFTLNRAFSIWIYVPTKWKLCQKSLQSYFWLSVVEW